MSLNYDYKKLCPFKWFVLQNFPYIDEDFDAITNYQLFCKIGEEINKIINSENQVGEQVEILTTAFNNLQAYVDNYFANLDVQDEINNKLDEMAEDGTLEEIIAEYLNTKAVFGFSTVAEMKLAENLINGSFAKTYGFYNVNDKGGAFYKIRTITNEDIIDESTIIALSDETLIAELQIENNMNVKQFGTKGDGETDDTSKLQIALNNCKNIEIPDGTYMVNALTSLVPNNNTKIKLSNGAKIKAITNNNSNYVILNISGKSNIEISGGTIEGDKDTHTGESGEWGHCVSISNNSENIFIHDILLTKAWGDGIYVNGAKHVRTQNVICDANRRQGMSIISVSDLHSLNDSFINTSGTLPQDGIDIEPNTSTDVLENILIENPYTYNNGGSGIQAFISRTHDKPISITIVNHKDEESLEGFSVALGTGNSGRILNQNCYYNKNGQRGIASNGYFGGNCQLIIDNPTILNCNQNEETAFNFSIPIVFYNTLIENPEEPISNITIKDFYLDNPKQTNSCCIGVNQADVDYDNINIINPKFRRGYIRCRTKLHFVDTYKKYAVSYNENTTIDNNKIISELNMEKATANRAYTLESSIPTGSIIRFINNSSYIMRLQLDSTVKCKYFNSNAGVRINLTHTGESVVLEKISDTEFVCLAVVGTPTVDNIPA